MIYAISSYGIRFCTVIIIIIVKNSPYFIDRHGTLKVAVQYSTVHLLSPILDGVRDALLYDR